MLRNIILLPLLLLAGGVGAMEGQERTQSSLEEIGRRIEALRPEMDVAHQAAVLADSLNADSVREANQVPSDTVLVGPLHVVTVPSQVELATEVFQEVWDTFHPLVRGSEEALSDHLFVFRYGWRSEGMFQEGEKVHSVEMSRRWGMTILKDKVRNGLGQALLSALPPDSSGLAAWVGNQPLGPPKDWSWIYRALASTPSKAVKACYRGELSWCWEALGLTESENGWLTWYSPPERRLLVEARFRNLIIRDGIRLDGAHLLLHDCLESGSDRACLEILSGRPRVPLENSARASIVVEALIQGGEGAFTRLIEHPEAPLKTRLAQAAGLPADTLAARWRERVFAAQPNVQADLIRSPFSLAFWLFLLFALAVRSTPWRMG